MARVTVRSLLVFAILPLSAQEVDVPVATQIPLFLKVTAFDRRITAAAPSELVVGVVYQSGNRQSTTARTEAEQVLGATPAVDGRTVRTIEIDIDREDLKAALRGSDITMLYVTPLRSVSIGSIAAAARDARVTTYTGVPKYIDQGLAVGVRRVGDRPKLLVNLRVARLEGADFSAEFLKLVEVIH